jgi:hypothetical protein
MIKKEEEPIWWTSCISNGNCAIIAETQRFQQTWRSMPIAQKACPASTSSGLMLTNLPTAQCCLRRCAEVNIPEGINDPLKSDSSGFVDD